MSDAFGNQEKDPRAESQGIIRSLQPHRATTNTCNSETPDNQVFREISLGSQTIKNLLRSTSEHAREVVRQCEDLLKGLIAGTHTLTLAKFDFKLKELCFAGGWVKLT